MKQTQLDKHTIAWFKIADCVSRGEKERALGVYRLLSHSFNDNAIARQLEADIYYSFGENGQAIPLYQQAMEWYIKSDRFLEAAAVGEHLIIMGVSDAVLHREMVQLYTSLGMVAKVRIHVCALVKLLAQKQQWYDIKNIITECASVTDDNGRSAVFSDTITTALAVGCPWDVATQLIEQAVDNLSKLKNTQCVQNFLSLIQAYSDQAYEYAVEHLVK